MSTIKTLSQRLDAIADEKIVTHAMIVDALMDEIDELRAALAEDLPRLSQAEQNHLRSEALSSKIVRWESPPDWAAS